MIEEGIRLFLQTLAISDKEIKKEKNWLCIKCPLAFHTHSKGIDSRPSFFISINPKGLSIYHCFGCTENAKSLAFLIHNIWLMTGKYPYAAANIFKQYEIFSDNDLEGRGKKTDIWNDYQMPDRNPLLPAIYSKYPLLQLSKTKFANECRDYLKMRGVASHIINMCGVRYDEGHKTLIFPFTDILGKIYVMRMRRIDRKEIWTVSPKIAGIKDEGVRFPTIGSSGVFFGTHLLDFSKTIMLVEAEITVLRLMSLGFFNVMASGTSMITREQIRSIIAESVILAYDSDHAGKKAHTRIKKEISRDIILAEIDWSLVKDKNGNPCKDGGDIVSRQDLIYILKRKKYLD